MYLYLLDMTKAGDNSVMTLPSATFETGSRGSLPCRYVDDIFAVYWRKKTDAGVTDLVILDNKGQRTNLTDDDRFNVTDDFSLIIDGVKAGDEGEYICEVLDFATGTISRNETTVTVVGK